MTAFLRHENLTDSTFFIIFAKLGSQPQKSELRCYLRNAMSNPIYAGKERHGPGNEFRTFFGEFAGSSCEPAAILDQVALLFSKGNQWIHLCDAMCGTDASKDTHEYHNHNDGAERPGISRLYVP
jgi:hypothetical protein